MAWTPASVTIGGETFVEADFAPFSFAATWPRFLEALRQHAADVAELAGIQQATSVAGTGAAYTFSVASTLLSGQGLWFRPHANNTGACTANAIPIKRSNGTDPAADELVAGTEYLLRYDGTNLRVLSLNVALAALSRLVPAADRLPYFTAAAGAALAVFTSFGRSLVAAADDVAARTVLGAQAADDTLTALAALAWASGAQVPVLTGADTFALRTIGAAAGSNLLDRDAGDGRYAAIERIQVATNVATSDGGITWTYDSPQEVADGGILLIEFPSTNPSAPSGLTAARNGGGTPRSLRDSDGQPIVRRGQLVAGRTYMGRRVGAPIELTNLDLLQWFLNRVRLIGSSATVDFQDLDTGTPLVRLASAIETSISLTTSAATSAGNAVLTFTDTAGVAVGMRASGTGVESNSAVIGVTSTTVTLSIASVAGVASGASITFGFANRLVVNGGGDNVTVGPILLDARTSGVRAAVGAGFVNENGARYFDPSNPPAWAADIQAHLELLTDGYWEDVLRGTIVSGTQAYPISGTDRSLDIASAGFVVRADGMAIDQRVSIEVRAGASATIIAPQVWAGTEDALALGNATLGSVTSDNASGTFVFTAGDPVALGVRRGDVWRFANLAATANNARDFTILAFGGTSNRTVTVTPPPATDAAPDSSWSMTRMGSRQLSLPANSFVEIERRQTRFLATQRAPFATVATAALPTPAIGLGWRGQSYPQRFKRHALRGLAETMPLLGLSRDVYSVGEFAYGASSELRGFDTTKPYMGDGSYVEGVSTDNGNFDWDHFNGEPGPNALAAIAALKADPFKATLRYLPILHGLNVMQNISATGDLTPDDIIASQVEFADYLEAETGIHPEYLVSCGPPAQERSATLFPDDRWWPVRDAYRRLPYQDARFLSGAEFYDLLRNRRGERHHPFQEARRFGKRAALHIAHHTNKLRNPLLTGAVAGTPGTLPMHVTVTVPSGVTREVVGSGTVNGRPYWEVRLHGTPGSTGAALIGEDTVSGIPAKAGQTWTGSRWVSLVAGSLSGLAALGVSTRGTNGSTATETFTTAIDGAISGSPQRFSATAPLASGSTTHVQAGVRYGYTSGVPFDLTLRIEGPQLERGTTASALCGPQWLGPEIVAFEEMSSTSFRWTIDYGVGSGIRGFDAPAGIALLPAGSSQFATSLPIVRYQLQNGPGTTVYLTTHTKDPASGARPAYPWGPCEALQSPSRLIRAYSDVIGDWLPLRTLDRTLLGL